MTNQKKNNSGLKHPMRRRRCVLVAAMAVLFLTGCHKQQIEVIDFVPYEQETLPTAAVETTPSPAATAAPVVSEPDDNGYVEIREDVLQGLAATTYEASQDTVILIYHTHAAEAYRQTDEYVYEETGENTYRTLDNTKNVIAVGEALKEELEGYGYTVIHDTSNVEEPELSSAYSRSLEVMEQYPEAAIYIDLHRNAADARRKKDDVVMINGERCARMFFVVGTGIGTYEGEYDLTPNWRKNYSLALSLTERLQSIDSGLATDVRTKAGRYNQHVSDMCLLLELGHNANTFQDVMNSVKWFAKAFSEVILLPENA